ncbi:hypothetical protein COCON_G00219690 [Conger conger]|uniref:Four-jointed box protein 1 n=1 Tax=Conger conger TaxID=82655 RepID=A0A9Q1CYA3_CONCO|nr:hypothetical protein COCON_G00219690 [Conger conger]
MPGSAGLTPAGPFQTRSDGPALSDPWAPRSHPASKRSRWDPPLPTQLWSQSNERAERWRRSQPAGAQFSGGTERTGETKELAGKQVGETQAWVSRTGGCVRSPGGQGERFDTFRDSKASRLSLEARSPKGFTEEHTRNWRARTRGHPIVSLEPGCGRISNRLATFSDGTKACVRYGINADQVQGETLTYYLAALLCIPNLPPLALSQLNLESEQWAAVKGSMASLQWTGEAIVSLTQEELENQTLEELLELVQWSDLILLDYLTANFDRLVSNLFSLQWDSRVMERDTSNLHRTPRGDLVFIDNEAGLVHGYRVLDMWEKYHSALLGSVCVFRRRTAQRVIELHRLRDARTRLLRLYRDNEPLAPELGFLSDEHAGILQNRIDRLYKHILHCKGNDAAARDNKFDCIMWLLSSPVTPERAGDTAGVGRQRCGLWRSQPGAFPSNAAAESPGSETAAALSAPFSGGTAGPRLGPASEPNPPARPALNGEGGCLFLHRSRACPGLRRLVTGNRSVARTPSAPRQCPPPSAPPPSAPHPSAAPKGTLSLFRAEEHLFSPPPTQWQLLCGGMFNLKHRRAISRASFVEGVRSGEVDPEIGEDSGEKRTGRRIPPGTAGKRFRCRTGRACTDMSQRKTVFVSLQQGDGRHLADQQGSLGSDETVPGSAGADLETVASAKIASVRFPERARQAALSPPDKTVGTVGSAGGRGAGRGRRSGSVQGPVRYLGLESDNPFLSLSDLHLVVPSSARLPARSGGREGGRSRDRSHGSAGGGRHCEGDDERALFSVKEGRKIPVGGRRTCGFTPPRGSEEVEELRQDDGKDIPEINAKERSWVGERGGVLRNVSFCFVVETGQDGARPASAVRAPQCLRCVSAENGGPLISRKSRACEVDKSAEPVSFLRGATDSVIGEASHWCLYRRLLGGVRACDPPVGLCVRPSPPPFPPSPLLPTPPACSPPAPPLTCLLCARDAAGDRMENKAESPCCVSTVAPQCEACPPLSQGIRPQPGGASELLPQKVSPPSVSFVVRTVENETPRSRGVFRAVAMANPAAASSSGAAQMGPVAFGLTSTQLPPFRSLAPSGSDSNYLTVNPPTLHPPPLHPHPLTLESCLGALSRQRQVWARAPVWMNQSRTPGSGAFRPSPLAPGARDVTGRAFVWVIIASSSPRRSPAATAPSDLHASRHARVSSVPGRVGYHGDRWCTLPDKAGAFDRKCYRKLLPAPGALSVYSLPPDISQGRASDSLLYLSQSAAMET